AMVRNPLAHPGGLAEIGALRRLLRERAIVDVRSYSVDEDSGGVGADVEAFGAGVERGAVTTRLLDASTRTIDGSWREREDCLRSA
ncbi:MAG TPA: hypothetical protein VHB30_12555, partial [Solirubrobacteraceae bacterium]|nr:hypothetical protein [Solirubrobacteraceae bacterium]